MRRAHQPQVMRKPRRAIEVRLDDAGDRPAGLEVIGSPPEQLAVKRRPKPPAPLSLATKKTS
jgi:hypothetical protein